MKKTISKILVIDDEESFRETIRLCLEDKSFNIITASSGEEGISLFEKERPDIVITDLKMPKMNGLDVLTHIKSLDKNVPIIMLTAFDDVPYTIEAMKIGAYDFVSKPIKVDALKSLIARALSNRASENGRDIDITNVALDHSYETGLIGKTAVMRELIKQIGPISTNRTNILIEGENGTGKEVLAHLIHSSGITKNQPFIGINCTALSSSLLESELFGHDKGSFTGAIKTKRGKFELAGEGTLFLDEISEMPLEMQVKMLRVLQEKEFERVGGEESIPFKARVIAATNQNLFRLVTEKKFRRDLYYRLKVVHLRVPPLRKRKEDIPALVVHLLGKINRELNKNVIKIPYETMELLKENYWDGNVRELENTLRRAAVLAKGESIEKENVSLPNYIDDEPIESNMTTLAEAQRKYIEFVLNQVNWNKHKACEILAITKPTLLKKIKEYNLHPANHN
ncbi:MAG: Fis family transcriptional regulator [Ignavibacteria bacterium RIFOXYB2_FULL_35_12]|nr:MAG: Fis family transcriptional regulator [Ignavibacteria bacterium GWF2_35_20]OGU78287.1 MAG: Fis family transcriptional regulator [Ignavibacteria bacterium RIFOXYA2_FULL_35_9]OGU87003.1 MAG: Fis family transcriptional regulator [Ignavibacteria bacterium RIFOXYA12_FULL_35_25]OGU93125.1 MAG: Fis family transcriptional regulator [Ignavibacteria bacterium RIFOXYB12_FULL_35_14]OGU98282.1 MAG: Fis family transcriptional regulator [Ignavibacteria bacterium RIFOXYC2_FULL_35_16]OGV03361.1 MAG: Fis